MLQEAGSELERSVNALSEKTNEAVMVKLVNFLQIRKHHVLLATQRLRQRASIHLRDVVVDDVLKGLDVADLSVDEFLHYQQLSSAKHYQ